jgi:hypothetical protein
MAAFEFAFQALFAACHSRCDTGVAFLGGQVEVLALAVVLHSAEQNLWVLFQN